MSDSNPRAGSGEDCTVAAAAGGPGAGPPDQQYVGGYRIIERVGEGGMGVIYRAEQRSPVRRIVALKVIKLGMDTREVVARFEAERQALAVMDHPNIARVLDAGVTEQGRPYFAMEYVAGVPLNRYCEDNRLETRARLELFVQVCQAVQHAHQKGIIHRDLKPSNVLVTMFDGRPVPKVIDFGIAKAVNTHLSANTLYTHTGALIGTPEYMSPEQAMTSGLDVDTRTDVYSLGVILYELLTRTTPFDAAALRRMGNEGMARMIRETEPPRPSTRLTTLAAGDGRDAALPAVGRRTDLRALRRELDGDLDWITLKAMEKDRTRRYETANALAMDVRRYLDGDAVLARPPTLPYRAQKFLGKHKAGMAAGAAVLGALVAGLGLATYGMVDARRARDQALRAQSAEAEQRAVVQSAKADTDAAIAALATLQATRANPSEDLARLEELSRRLDGGWLKDQSQAYASCRLALGYAHAARGAIPAAEKQFLAGAESLRPASGGWRTEAAPLLRALGILAERQSRWPDAERYFADALACYHRMSPPPHGDIHFAMVRLALARELQGDAARAAALRLEARRVNVEAGTAAIRADPGAAHGYERRGFARMGLGQWREAVPDLVRVTELDPTDHWTAYHLALLHAYLGDDDAYRKLCAANLARFGQSKLVYVPERMAKACLVTPDLAGTGLATLAPMIDGALAPGAPEDYRSWFHSSKALLEYRAGRYGSALEWIARARALGSGSGQATLDSIEAMSWYQMGNPGRAREALKVARERYTLTSNEDDSSNHLILCVLRREAEALLAGDGVSQATRPSPPTS